MQHEELTRQDFQAELVLQCPSQGKRKLVDDYQCPSKRRKCACPVLTGMGYEGLMNGVRNKDSKYLEMGYAKYVTKG